MQIVPMRDLKDTVKIEKMCEESQGPVFVTKNGYGKLVVMNIEYFEKIMKDAYEARELIKGLDDIKNNRIVEAESVFKEIKTKYGF